MHNISLIVETRFHRMRCVFFQLIGKAADRETLCAITSTKCAHFSSIHVGRLGM